MARLASDVWVSAYLRRLDIAAIPAVILSRGNAQAGAILVKLNRLNGQAELYRAQYDFSSDTHKWVRVLSDDEPAVDAMIARERARDTDMWVIEVEDQAGRHLLDEPGLAR